MTTYEKIERSKLWSLIQSGAELYVVEMKQLKVLVLNDLTVSQIKFYFEDPDAFFIQATRRES